MGCVDTLIRDLGWTQGSFWRLTRACQQGKRLTYPSHRAWRGSGALPEAALSGRLRLQYS